MREIKFKVRDKVLKTMITDDINISLLMDGRVKENYTLVQWYSIKESLIPLQYTWIKDKNWKEIYEGDILEYSIQWTIQIPNYVVKDIQDIRLQMNRDDPYYRRDETITVLGNIYEDKHLLTN